MQQHQLRAKWLPCSTRFFAFVSSLKPSRWLLSSVRFFFVYCSSHTVYNWYRLFALILKYRRTKLSPSFLITLYKCEEYCCAFNISNIQETRHDGQKLTICLDALHLIMKHKWQVNAWLAASTLYHDSKLPMLILQQWQVSSEEKK
jgi:hypothetical protein